jgi:tRNA(Ile)-lysidine synthase
LAAQHQSFCLDESNEDPSYTRNRIRHALLPQLAAQYNPQVREALLRLGQLAEDAQFIIQDRARELLLQAMRSGSQNHIVLNGAVLSDEAPFLICEVLILLWKEQSWPLQQMGMAEWNAIAKLVTQPGGEHRIFNLPGNIRAAHSGCTLELTRQE